MTPTSLWLLRAITFVVLMGALVAVALRPWESPSEPAFNGDWKDLMIEQETAATVVPGSWSGDWKDQFIGQSSAASTYTGDWKDLVIGQAPAASTYTGDWKDLVIQQ
jgi:hypothetical protein